MVCCEVVETYTRREIDINGSQGYKGIRFHIASLRTERKLGAESMMCGQTPADALERISALSAGHGSFTGVSHFYHTLMCTADGYSEIFCVQLAISMPAP